MRPLSPVVLGGGTADEGHLRVELAYLVEASPVRDVVHEEYGVVLALGEDVLPHLCGLESWVVDHLYQVRPGSVCALGAWLWLGYFELMTEGS